MILLSERHFNVSVPGEGSLMQVQTDSSEVDLVAKRFRKGRVKINGHERASRGYLKSMAVRVFPSFVFLANTFGGRFTCTKWPINL